MIDPEPKSQSPAIVLVFPVVAIECIRCKFCPDISSVPFFDSIPPADVEINRDEDDCNDDILCDVATAVDIDGGILSFPLLYLLGIFSSFEIISSVLYFTYLSMKALPVLRDV